MGCDIHLKVEIRNGEGWKSSGEVFDRPEWSSGKGKCDDPYFGRNYYLFGLLAGVRDEIEGGPIAKPRGIPKDASKKVKDEHSEWNGDAHTASWLTLKELLDFDWDSGSVRKGIVDATQYKEFKKKGKPSGWCGGVGGGMTKIVENSQMDSLLAAGYDKLKLEGEAWSLLPHFYTAISWKETHRSACSDFLTTVIPQLKKLADPENVRIVFWFDN